MIPKVEQEHINIKSEVLRSVEIHVTFSAASSFAFLLRRGVETRARFSGGGGVAGVPRVLDRVRRPPSNEPPNAFSNSSPSTRARSKLVKRFDGVDFVGVFGYIKGKRKKKRIEKNSPSE